MHKPFDPTPQEWDAFVCQQPNAHVLQLSAWGDLKSKFGWTAERIALKQDTNNDIVAGAQVLYRPLPFNAGTMAYVGMGPYAKDDASLKTLWRIVHKRARAHNAIFLKWEPGIDANVDPAAFNFKPSPQTIQPPRTVMLDIADDDDAILARMNQGTRRKIRQGEKKGVRYYEGGRADLITFNHMTQTTGKRNEFGVHDPAYYEAAFELFVPDHAALILAEHEGDPLAGIMVFAVGKTAWYLYGASSNVKRNLMATYGVQWAAIQWAKARGCTQYDMWGVPDEDAETLEAQFQERSDGLWGVYGFKRGWGGDVLRSAGAWDYAYNPLLYFGYRTVLNLRD